MANKEPNEQPFDRIPPASIEAEAAVLGACLMDPAALDMALAVLQGAHFFKGSHRIIFEACRELSLKSNSGRVDMVTVQDLLKGRGQLEAAGGPMGLASLNDRMVSGTNIEAYCRLIYEKSKLRDMITACTVSIADAYARQEEPSLVIDAAESRIFDVGAKQDARGMQQIGQGWEDEFNRLQAVSTGKIKAGRSTGVSWLDHYTGGMRDGKLWVVAARPGGGKSALALQIATHLAMNDSPTAFFSIEMKKEELRARIASSYADIDSQRFQTKLTENELQRYKDQMYKLKNTPLYLNDEGDMTLERLVSLTRRYVRLHRVKNIFIDYIQLLTAEGFRPSERVQEVTKITRTLKREAEKLRCTFFTLAQFNKEGLKNPKGRPTANDLRESGSLHQDADVILILDPDSNEPGETRVHFHVDKNRGGSLDQFLMNFQKPLMRFINITYAEEQGAPVAAEPPYTGPDLESAPPSEEPFVDMDDRQ